MSAVANCFQDSVKSLRPVARQRLELVLRVDERLRDRYSCNTDYYYSTLINTIMGHVGTRNSSLQIRYTDLQTDLEEDEFLKRPYMIHEYDNKMKLLSEYYKFHQDVPRIFSQPMSQIIRTYHDRKRRLEYQRIKKMLAEEALRNNQRVTLQDNGKEIGFVAEGDMAYGRQQEDEDYQGSFEGDTSNQDSSHQPRQHQRGGEYQLGPAGSKQPFFERILTDDLLVSPQQVKTQ